MKYIYIYTHTHTHTKEHSIYKPYGEITFAHIKIKTGSHQYTHRDTNIT